MCSARVLLALLVVGVQGLKVAKKEDAKVFFLFMVNDKLPNPEIWEAYFHGADPAKYRVLLHCRNQGDCQGADEVASISALKKVDTQPSSYCRDLVTPMNELLRRGLEDPEVNENDKFVFVSGDSVPVKKFEHAHADLMKNQGSSFCTLPTQRWLKEKSGTAVKHSQWIVLTRAHAEKSVKLADSQGIPALWKEGEAVPNCLDEFWHFNAVYGTIPHGKELADLADFRGDSVANMKGVKHEQGHCATFVNWSFEPSVKDPLKIATKDYDDQSPSKLLRTKLSEEQVEFAGRAGHDIELLSQTSVAHLFQSPYLFARKLQALQDEESDEEVLQAFVERLW